MGRRTFEATATAAAPAAVVWEVLVDGPGWPGWTFVPRAAYEREGVPAPHGVGAVRRFGSWPFFSREEVTVFEPPARFAYRAVSGLPVKSYESEVRLAPDGDGFTVITWRSAFEEKLPGTGRLLAAGLGRMVSSFARNLARESAHRAGA